MFNYQQKKQIRKVIYSKITLLILFILIIILSKAYYGIYKKQIISNQNLKIVKEEFDSLKSRKDVLEFEINKLNTEEGLEREIRSKFNVSKPGEVVVNIVDENKNNDLDIVVKDVGFWDRIFKKILFFIR
jgi:cell division protein FtsB